MNSRFSLRARVTILIGVVSLLMGALFLAATYLLQDRLEGDLIRATLHRALVGALGERAPEAADPAVEDIRLYGLDKETVPAAFRGLGPGMHEIERAGRILEVVVEDTAIGRHVLVYDETRHHRRERWLVIVSIAVVMCTVALAGIGGYYASGLALAPLRRFADRLRALPPNADGPALQPDYAHTEVGEIAEAFDRYRARLSGFIERERAFTADASHELRTPLAVIQNAAELLRVPELSGERQQRAAGRIEGAAREISELLGALLYLAREQDDGIAPQQRCRVDEAMAEVAEESRAAPRGVEIELRIEEPVRVDSRRGLVVMVLRNLLDNAIRYSDRGRVAVTVGAGAVTVTDSGPGITDDELPRVFERHYRGGGRDRAPDRGLGLAIVRRICELEGWTLDLHSEAGRGLTAIVRFTD